MPQDQSKTQTPAGLICSASGAKCENCGTEYPSRMQAEACCWADKEIDPEMIRLKSERDEVRTWLVKLAQQLAVDFGDFRSTEVADEYRELRERIMAKLPSNIVLDGASTGNTFI